MSIFKNRTGIGIICILVALVICFGITPLFNQGMGISYGVVKTQLSGRSWTAWLEVPYINYN